MIVGIMRVMVLEVLPRIIDVRIVIVRSFMVRIVTFMLTMVGLMPVTMIRLGSVPFAVMLSTPSVFIL